MFDSDAPYITFAQKLALGCCADAFDRPIVTLLRIRDWSNNEVRSIEWKDQIMSAPAPSLSAEIISFGPFNLVVSERLLTRDGVPIALSARALDILIILLSQPNEVITKEQLLERVWPNITVEEGNLRYHIAGLRKAIGDGKSGVRYIETLPGQGYSFIGPVLRTRRQNQGATANSTFRYANLPKPLTRLIGREDDISQISSRLNNTRFVTIVGSGGVGKTTVALAVANEIIDAFAGAVVFVDLGSLNEPKLIVPTLASMLGLSVQSEDPTKSILAYLRNKRVLLILDTCEHLVDAVASLASLLVKNSSQTNILATSRQTLLAEGENLYWLEPLVCPSPDNSLTLADLRNFPATHLFLERAISRVEHLDLDNADAKIVATICRKLDGVPLAIELAARRVVVFGLQQTADLLDQRLTLPWVGPRTAPPRQKTLQATLDWSFNLLSEVERTVLCNLTHFVGHFTIDAARTVAISPGIDEAAVLSAIDSLVAKSMVTAHPIGASMRYRLLDITRDYALGIKIDVP
jgi:predicted ATPase/DNA-binding winged helix-turn-helix (wHTH) protein